MSSPRIHRFYPGDRIAVGDPENGDDWDVGTVRSIASLGPGDASLMRVMWERALSCYSETLDDEAFRLATAADERALANWQDAQDGGCQ